MKRLFLLLALCGMVAVGCTEGGVDDNIDNGGNNTEQPGEDDDNTEQPGEDDDDENKEDETTFITDSEGNFVVEAEGGEVVVTVTTDIEYSVEIPEEAQSWLSVADTRAIRMEKLTFTVAKNEADAERRAIVKLLGSDNAELQSLLFVQEGATAEETQAIKFQDENTKLLCTLLWDENEDGELSYEEAAAVTDLGTAFKGSSILAFSELEYFTSLEKIADNTFMGCVSLVKITLPEQVTAIGASAFNGCTNLKNITVPDSVTSIGYDAFSGCISLPVIDNIRYADTCLVEAVDRSLTSYSIKAGTRFIGIGAFSGCESLTSITIPDSVTSIGVDAFYGCTSLESITIPDSVTSIGYGAFQYCDSLTSVTIPDSVTSIGKNAFYRCHGELIVNCNIPSASTDEYGAFYGSWFTRVTIGDSVTSIGSYAFYDCTSLTSITIPDSVTSIGSYAFYDCTSLTSITIPDSVTSIGEWAFRKCGSLESVTIGNGVTSIGDMAFYDCNSLTSVYITDIAAWCKISFGGTISNPLSYSGNLYLNNELVTDLIIPDSVTSIGSYAFSGCTSLTSVTIPDSVAEIGSSAFSGCTSLTSITIPDSVTTIGDYAFCDCTSLTSVTIGNGVTSIGDGAFSFCYSLTSITIPDSVTSIGEKAFYLCDSLTSVYITDIAAWCKISFGGIGSNPLSAAENLYLNNELVTDLIIPDSVTSIGSRAFSGCTSLTSITIPDSVTTIGSWAFEYCTSLTSITIPDSVTSIGEKAFYDCTSLTSVTIPDRVTSIGDGAFSYCTSLKEVYCKPTTPPTGGYLMFYDNAPGRTIYVPRNSVSAYKSASGWSSYASAIFGYDF